MAKVQFDPELMRNIKIIYGDADLDERTLRQLHQTWATNPDIIRRTAQQKMPKLQEAYFDAPEMPSLPTRLEPLPTAEIAQDDLRGVKDFKTAFRAARERGLKQFMWGKGRYTTQLAKPTNKRVGIVEVGEAVTENPYVRYNSDNTRATTYLNRVNSNGELAGVDSTSWIKPPTTDMYGNQLSEEQIKHQRSWEQLPKHQQGGTMNNQQELQKAFVAYLIQDAQTQGVQIQSEQDLQAYAEQLGEDGIKAKYQEFMQKMQGGVMARLGAKLEYYKKLKGVCPEGEELVYFKQGGRICKACQKAQKGTKVTEKANEVDKFKAGRAQYKKDMKSARDEASRDSISINKYNDQETMANKGHKGNFQGGKWVPDRKQYAKKDACGSKMKVNKCGSKMKKK